MELQEFINRYVPFGETLESYFEKALDNYVKDIKRKVIEVKKDSKDKFDTMPGDVIKIEGDSVMYECCLNPTEGCGDGYGDDCIFYHEEDEDLDLPLYDRNGNMIWDNVCPACHCPKQLRCKLVEVDNIKNG
jgi:hypothetical protein